MGKKKRVQVMFTEDQWELIKNLEGTLGETDSSIVRNIVLSWLVEKSFISQVVKEDMKANEITGENKTDEHGER